MKLTLIRHDENKQAVPAVHQYGYFERRMIMRFVKNVSITFLFISLLVVMGFSLHCGAEVPNPDTFMFATNEDIPTLDPAVSYENTGFRVMYVMYDRLVTYEGTSTDYQPMLAASWDISEDGKTYTFYLRDDAKFHDGTPVTAEDVRYSFVRLMAIEKGPSGLFSGILDEGGIEAIDDQTIKFTLLTNYPPFMTLLGMNCAAVVNADLVQSHEVDGDYGEAWLTENEAGSGSFILDSWKRGESLVMVANQEYWGGAPKLEKAVIRFITESATQRMMLETGELDTAEGIGREALEQMKDQEGIVVEEVPGMSIHYIAINASKEPLTDVLVRKALSQAIDFDAMIEGIYLNHSIRLNSAVPKGLLGHDDKVPYFEYDPASARQLLVEAGYADGFSLEFLVAEFDTWVQVATVVQAQLAELNINVNISKYAWPTYLEKIMNGEHDLCMMGWSPDFADPDQNMFTFLHSSNFGAGWNFTFYKNEEIDDLLVQARNTVDREQRQELYSKISFIAYEEVPYLWVAQHNVRNVFRDWVKGYSVNPMMYWYIPFHKITKE